MKFDYMIMNPPYGSQGGNLARKIINKSAKYVNQKLIVLAPIRSSKDQLSHIENIQYIGNANQYFDLSCPALSINTIVPKEVNIYKNLEDARLNDKQLVYLQKVKEYNKAHKPFYKDLHGYCNLKRKEELKNVREDLLFVITNWCPSDKVHKGKSEDRDHNIDHLPINWNEKSTIYTIEFDSKDKIHNFINWWYKIPGRGIDAQKTLIYFILDILCEAYNAGPSIRKYPIVFPNLDWSRSWVDEEILKEIGLSEDFLIT